MVDGARPPLQPDSSAAKSELRAWLRDIFGTFVPALLVVILLNLFVAQATRVEGQSMEPSLHNNQRLIIEKISYHFRSVERGDIIVLKLPDRPGPPLIKRVIGLPGERVEIRGGQVHVNGKLLTEPYLNQLTYSSHQRQVVPENSVFVLGDNRGHSSDSRYFGVVKVEYIVGRAWFCYWPPEDVGLVH
jgi:signal peptidase I